MSDKMEAPQTILEQIIEEMFKKLEKEDDFNPDILEKMRNLSKKNSIIKGEDLLDILKQGVSSEDP